MKKLLILLLVFFKHLFPVYSQSHETIFLYLDTERNGSEAFVRVRAIHANDILAFQFGIDINPLEYKISEIKSYEYPASNVIGLPLFAFDSLSKTLRCIWNQLGGQNASIPDDQVLLEFKLTQLNPPADSCLKFSNNLVFVTEFLGNSGSYDVIVSNSCEKLSFGSISGEVLLDEDKNCQKDQIYHPLNNFTIVLESTTGDKFIAKTFNSKFVKSLLPGDYKVEVIPPVPVWQLCQYPSVITIPANREKITFEALSNSAIDCKQIEVNVLGDRLRLCAESIVFVNYANVGTVDVDNVSIELTLDNNLELTMCSYPYVSIGNNKFKIQVGQVKITESNSFFIGVKTPCDIGLLNQTACIEANSSPFEFCLPDPLWSGANLKITPRCLSSKVAFDVENNGIGDMKESINYNIVEDDLLPGSQGLIKLNKNEKKTIEYPANGRTIRIIVDTISNHPYHQKFTSAVEACRANMEKVSTGFVTQYSFEDDAPNVDLACYRLVASYDPNDKNATPVGITDMHFIEKNSRLQYLIRFQNTGTDTAYKVRIQDEISDKLDLQSLRIEGASHPFNTSLEDGRLLAFTYILHQILFYKELYTNFYNQMEQTFWPFLVR